MGSYYATEACCLYQRICGSQSDPKKAMKNHSVVKSWYMKTTMISTKK